MGDSGMASSSQVRQCNMIEKEEGCIGHNAKQNYIFNYDSLETSRSINEMSQSFQYPEDAMEKCERDEECCGISYHKYCKWTLRYGDVETINIQIRKDCFQGGYTSKYCIDQNPGICNRLLKIVYKGDRKKFEDEYCSSTKANELNCLKTCKRCLVKSTHLRKSSKQSGLGASVLELGATYTKLEVRNCFRDRYGNYSTIEAAQNACTRDNNCQGVYD